MQKRILFGTRNTLKIIAGIITVFILNFMVGTEGIGRQGVGPFPDAEYFASVNIATEESIRERIVSETTGLAAALSAKREVEIIRLLRRWAAANIDLNEKGTSYWLKLDRNNRTLGNMLYLFDQNLLGVYCGDASRFLQKIYTLFGFESIFYDSGVYFRDPDFIDLNEGYTHVIILVLIIHENKELWVAEDVLFDTEYRLPGEEVSDFAKVLAEIGSSPHRRIDRHYDQIVFTRERLSISENAANTADKFVEFARSIQVITGPDQLKFSWDTWIKQESSSAQIVRELLGFDGHVYPYHLFRFPIGQSKQIPGVNHLQSAEDIYKSRL